MNLWCAQYHDHINANQVVKRKERDKRNLNFKFNILICIDLSRDSKRKKNLTFEIEMEEQHFKEHYCLFQFIVWLLETLNFHYQKENVLYGS
jgi:hypothetical protein